MSRFGYGQTVAPNVFQELMVSSWRHVSRNRRRYKFAIVCLATGICGVILVLNVGDSIEKKMGEHLTVLGGATIIDVERSDFDSHHPGEYDPTDVQRLRVIPHVLEVAPIVSVENIEATLRAASLIVRLAGVDQSFWSTIMAHCSQGRLIGASDVAEAKAVCVLGEGVMDDLFGYRHPLGSEISIDNRPFRVIGTLGGIQGPDTLRTVFIPFTTASRHFSSLGTIKDLRLRVDHWDNVESVAAVVSSWLRSRHSGFQEGIRVIHYPERIRSVRDTTLLLKVLSVLTSLAAVILGGVGTAFLMLSSVVERTREIGLRKALGATDFAILFQFVSESILVTMIGGSAGIGAACIGCAFLAIAFGLTVQPWLFASSALGSLIAMMLLGLVAGYYPARKASSMDPARAIRSL